MGILVRLTMPEFMIANTVALARMTLSELRGHNHASTYEREWWDRKDDEVAGACGELALARANDSYWPASVDTFHTVPDVPGMNADVRTYWREEPDRAHLIVRPNDPEDRWYYLVTGVPPEMTIRGGIWGGAARRDEWWRDVNDHRKFAWWVPQSHLRFRG